MLGDNKIIPSAIVPANKSTREEKNKPRHLIVAVAVCLCVWCVAAFLDVDSTILGVYKE
jgi:hypothetical protein